MPKQPFSWCLSGHHKTCPVSYDWNNEAVKCECTCHEEG
jgi:hypothetical protein